MPPAERRTADIISPAITLVDALRKLPATATAEQLCDYLLHLRGQVGAFMT
jgi:hypothetical protein